MIRFSTYCVIIGCDTIIFAKINFKAYFCKNLNKVLYRSKDIYLYFFCSYKCTYIRGLFGYKNLLFSCDVNASNTPVWWNSHKNCLIGCIVSKIEIEDLKNTDEFVMKLQCDEDFVWEYWQYICFIQSNIMRNL